MSEEIKQWVEQTENATCETGYGSPRISSECPDCALPLTFDSYSYCSMGCMYCFAYFSKANNPAMKGMKLRSTNPANLTPKNKKTYEYFYKHRFVLHIGGLADPFCGFEKKFGVGYKMLEYLSKEKYPTLFSTKGPTLLNKKYLQLFDKSSKNLNYAFQFSITTADDKLAKIVEPLVPSPTNRIKMIKTLSGMGYWTILRLRPYLMGITDVTIMELLQKCKDAGIKGVSMEFLCLDMRASEEAKNRYGTIGKVSGFGDVDYFSYYKALSPSKRGGYYRLNRDVKEKYVKEVYKFCLDNDLVFCSSDPDYKELSQSDCCCALPTEYPQNPEMVNYNHYQITSAIREARKLYWTHGVTNRIHFEDVYPSHMGSDKTIGFLEDNIFSYDHPSIVSFSMGKRKALTLRGIFQASWNNLQSPSNPYNYFHGKLNPIDRDEAGNLIFTYVPSEYEFEWVKEGIDLTL